MKPTEPNDSQSTATSDNPTRIPCLLTLSEAVAVTRLSKRKLQQEMAAGALPYIKIGRSIRLIPADIEKYIAARRIEKRRGR